MSDACCGDDPRDDAGHDGRGHRGPGARTAVALTSTLPLVTKAGSENTACECCEPVSSTGLDAPARGLTARGSVDLDDCCAPAPRAADQPLVHEAMLPWWRDQVLALPAVSGVLLAVALLASALGAPAAAVVVLELSSLAAGAATFVPGALRRLVRRRLGVGLLMTIAAVGAVVLGRYGEAAALAFLFSIAEALEHRAMDRAQKGLRALLALIPDRARVRQADGDTTIPAADLRVGDLLVLGAGDRVSTDGVVVEGSSSLDTAAVTGESIPVEVGEGDAAPAGSVNGAGTLLVRATADGGDNSLTQIVRLVEEAHARKGERARLADRIARPLVPAILLLAAAVALLGLALSDDPGTWIERALVVLVAASPCALAIAVPVTVISAIGSASKFGVVIKSGEAFEQLGTIRRVAFDKTGTLTRNQPEVVTVHLADGWSRPEVLRLAAALEATSTHPLADAVRTKAPDHDSVEASDIVERAGLGVTGTVNGRHCRIGSPRWLDAGSLAPGIDTLADQGMSILVLEVDGSVAALVGVRDELRAEAAETVVALARRGVTSMMLTGDNRRTAHALAHQVGITDVRAEQSPADKAGAVEASARQAPTAMIGDGINDAPALAGATVGIAMGVTGSAAAVESADVAFTGTDLRLIGRALEHARRGRRIMTANIALAVAIVVVLVPLAATGVLGLAEVVLVHEVAEVVVILNGVRAARTGRPTHGLARSRVSSIFSRVRTVRAS